jgi:hypothetical protein
MLAAQEEHKRAEKSEADAKTSYESLKIKERSDDMRDKVVHELREVIERQNKTIERCAVWQFFCFF